MAQALTVYKNLIGNKSPSGLPQNSDTMEQVKNDAPSWESGDEGSPGAEDDNQIRAGDPVFSLQRPKKDNNGRWWGYFELDQFEKQFFLAVFSHHEICPNILILWEIMRIENCGESRFG